jgi:hypothetical protein
MHDTQQAACGQRDTPKVICACRGDGRKDRRGCVPGLLFCSRFYAYKLPVAVAQKLHLRTILPQMRWLATRKGRATQKRRGVTGFLTCADNLSDLSRECADPRYRGCELPGTSSSLLLIAGHKNPRTCARDFGGQSRERRAFAVLTTHSPQSLSPSYSRWRAGSGALESLPAARRIFGDIVLLIEWSGCSRCLP